MEVALKAFSIFAKPILKLFYLKAFDEKQQLNRENPTIDSWEKEDNVPNSPPYATVCN